MYIQIHRLHATHKQAWNLPHHCSMYGPSNSHVQKLYTNSLFRFFRWRIIIRFDFYCCFGILGEFANDNGIRSRIHTIQVQVLHENTHKTDENKTTMVVGLCETRIYRDESTNIFRLSHFTFGRMRTKNHNVHVLYTIFFIFYFFVRHSFRSSCTMNFIRIHAQCTHWKQAALALAFYIIIAAHTRAHCH